MCLSHPSGPDRIYVVGRNPRHTMRFMNIEIGCFARTMVSVAATRDYALCERVRAIAICPATSKSGHTRRLDSSAGKRLLWIVLASMVIAGLQVMEAIGVKNPPLDTGD